MAGVIVTADVGNARLKLRVWSADADAASGVPAAALDAAHAAPGAESIEAFLRAVPGPFHVAQSSVASESDGALLRALLARVPGAAWIGAADAGLVLDVRAPALVGADRLYAARGAWELLRGPAIVLDAGTALTVDALDVDAGRPRFRGGAIAPGPRLLALALHEHTARLPLVDARPGAAALGRDTAQALQSGVVHGLRGAARELAQRVAGEAEIPGAPLLITGGAAAFLFEPPLFAAARHEPDLVHRGLLAAARAALGT